MTAEMGLCAGWTHGKIPCVRGSQLHKRATDRDEGQHGPQQRRQRGQAHARHGQHADSTSSVVFFFSEILTTGRLNMWVVVERSSVSC